MFFLAFFAVFVLLVENSLCVRHCEGDGKYEDDEELGILKLADGGWQEHCDNVTHNLTIADSEDIPTSACKRRFCPSCIERIRQECAKGNRCDGCDNCNICCHVERMVGPDSNDLCKDIGADCSGLCHLIDQNSKNVTELINENKGSPYKICRTLGFC